MQLGADGAVSGYYEGLVRGGEEDLSRRVSCRPFVDLRGEVRTPMAMAGKMYFMRFFTSGMPWCFDVSPLLARRSMSPPSSSEPPLGVCSSQGAAPSGAMPAPGSIGGPDWCCAWFASGSNGDVSVAYVPV